MEEFKKGDTVTTFKKGKLNESYKEEGRIFKVENIKKIARKIWLQDKSHKVVIATRCKLVRREENKEQIRPQHYGGEDDPYEPIKVIRAWGLGFELGNVLKYIRRAGKKDNAIEDLEKAKTYLEMEIEKLKAI